MDAWKQVITSSSKRVQKIKVVYRFLIRDAISSSFSLNNCQNKKRICALEYCCYITRIKRIEAASLSWLVSCNCIATEIHLTKEFTPLNARLTASKGIINHIALCLLFRIWNSFCERVKNSKSSFGVLRSNLLISVMFTIFINNLLRKLYRSDNEVSKNSGIYKFYYQQLKFLLQFSF